MTAVDSAIWEVVGIVNRSWRQCCRKNKAMIDINGRVLFESIMRRIFLNNPVGVKVSMEFKGSRPVTSLSYALCLFANK